MAVPPIPATVNETGPVEAPTGTVAVTVVRLNAVTVAGTKLVNETTLLVAETSSKAIPLSVTVEPTTPVAGEIEVMMGDMACEGT